MILDINNTERVLLGHDRQERPVWASHAEIIENFLQQEKEGVRAMYLYRDYKSGEVITPPGYLVASLWYGCGVVYRRKCDNKLILITGVQGDFVCNFN